MAFCALLGLHAAAQTPQLQNITGFVVDKWGKPVEGAKVQVLDKTASTAYTGEDGKFSLTTLPDRKISVIAADNSRKTISLTGDGKPLMVVLDYASSPVDIGFGVRQTVGESTMAVSGVSGEELNKRSAKNVGNSLFGYGLGLTTGQTSGEYTAQNPWFYVRGMKTLAGNSPLILVDGIERDINYINPDEVENVFILKDAPALALYGYKGINGAINVVTKRGKYKSNEIHFNYDHLINWQERRPKFVDGYTYASALNEALANDDMTPRYTTEELDAFKSGKYPYLYPNVDWINETFKNTGATNLYNISFRGGATKFRYYTFVDLQLNKGYVAHPDENEGYSTQSKYSKASLRMNLDIDLTPGTKASFNFKGVLTEASRAGMSSDDIWGKLYTVPAAAFPIKTENGLWGGGQTWNGSYNTVAMTQAHAYSKGHARALDADLTLTQDLSVFTPGLGVFARLAYDNYAAYWEDHTKSFKYGYDMVDGWKDGEPVKGELWTGGTDSDMAGGSNLDGQRMALNFSGGFNYDRTFGKHSLSSLLMWNYEYRYGWGVNTTFYRQNASSYTHYGYNDKYFADLSLTVSGSNKLAPGHKWSFSPTVSAAWVISGERFMKNVAFVNFLKLRASWGIINVDNFPTEGYWLQTFGGGDGYYIGTNYDYSYGWAEGQLAAVNSTHERGHKYNIGLDATLFKGLNITFDQYYERRSDIWVSSSGANTAMVGVPGSYRNAGIVDSWGSELGADYILPLNKYTRLTLGGNFTFTRNKIIEELETPQAYDYLKATGKRIGQLFGLEAVGLFKDQADIDNSPVQQFMEVKSGDIKYKDQNGDGFINANDRVALGYTSYLPEIYYSFHLGAEWKGLGFDAQFQGTGHYSGMLSTTSVYWPLLSSTTISQHYYDNRWTPEHQDAKYPRLSSQSNANNYQSNSLWLADLSFLKLRHVELYYNLPESLLKFTGFVRQAKFYIRGIDLLCFDHIKIADPEQLGAAYPLDRSVVLGLSIGF